jgi:hypothetical protein
MPFIDVTISVYSGLVELWRRFYKKALRKFKVVRPERTILDVVSQNTEEIVAEFG